MYMENMKNRMGFLCVDDYYDYSNKEKICAVIGANTPLFPFASMLIKMNGINIRKKTKNDESNTD